MYTNVTYNDSTGNCAFDWLVDKQYQEPCSWIAANPDVSSVEKLGSSSFIHLGPAPTYDISGCGLPYETSPGINFYYETSNSCITFMTEENNLKLFLTMDFTNLLTYNLTRVQYMNKYAVENTLEMLDEIIWEKEQREDLVLAGKNIFDVGPFSTTSESNIDVFTHTTEDNLTYPNNDSVILHETTTTNETMAVIGQAENLPE